MLLIVIVVLLNDKVNSCVDQQRRKALKSGGPQSPNRVDLYGKN